MTEAFGELIKGSPWLMTALVERTAAENEALRRARSLRALSSIKASASARAQSRPALAYRHRTGGADACLLLTAWSLPDGALLYAPPTRVTQTALTSIKGDPVRGLGSQTVPFDESIVLLPERAWMLRDDEVSLQLICAHRWRRIAAGEIFEDFKRKSTKHPTVDRFLA